LLNSSLFSGKHRGISVALSTDQIARIKRIKRDELLANAQSEDLGSLVEVTLRLHETTTKLNWVLIALTAALVYAAFRFGQA
jgi:hypothetical protein